MRHIILILFAMISILCMGCGKKVLGSNVNAKVSKERVLLNNVNAEVPRKSEILIGEFSTSLSKAGAGKIHNVKLAAQFLDGYVLGPGKIFSYNAIVGPRTIARGFKKGPVFIKGKLMKSIGGGICQLSGTLHGAVKASELRIIERHKHSRPVDYCSRKEEAAIVFGQKDFRFINNTNHKLKITIKVDGDKNLIVRIWKI